MDVQIQDSARVSEKEQLSAPSGWTKKLVPASAKSITLRKHDVIFIAPDGQEVKSKWHLSRYLKAHPNGPAPSEFNWSSGEEAPIRRSSRVVATTKEEDPVVEKSSTRKKNKRNASEMDSEEAESHKEKPQARKRAKNAGKSTDLDGGAQDAADVPDEVSDKAACNNEAMDALPLDDDQKLKNETTEAEASKEDVIEKVVEVEASSEVVTEKVVEVEESSGVVTEKEMDEVLDLQGEAVVPNATPDEEVYLSEDTVVGVEEVITEREVHAENEVNVVQETCILLDSLGELMGEQAALEFEQPMEHDDDNVMKTDKPVEQTDGNITGLEENLGPKSEVNNEVFSKVSMVSSVTMTSSVVEEVSKGNDTPLDPLTHEEEPLGPLVQKEEQERPATHVEIKERSPSEVNGSAVPVNVSNQ